MPASSKIEQKSVSKQKSVVKSAIIVIVTDVPLNPTYFIYRIIHLYNALCKNLDQTTYSVKLILNCEQIDIQAEA